MKHNTLGWGLGTVGAVAIIAAMSLISTQSQARKSGTAFAVTAEAMTPANIEMWVSTLDEAKDDTALPVDPAGLIQTAAKSELDLQCLSEAIYYEARSETSKGQKAVAEVVMNRVSSRHYPNSNLRSCVSGVDPQAWLSVLFYLRRLNGPSAQRKNMEALSGYGAAYDYGAIQAADK